MATTHKIYCLFNSLYSVQICLYIFSPTKFTFSSFVVAYFSLILQYLYKYS